MKIKYLSLIFPALLLFSACDKDGDLKVETPSLNVSGYTVTDAVDTLGNVVKQVEFNLEGDADVISFYSGQVFEDYAFKDGRILPTQALNVSFEYSASMGSGTNPEWEQLSIHYSKDFNGSMTAEAINSAEWTDITDRFALPLAKDITARTPTQDDLADLVTPGEPLYIAFKYVTPPRTVSSAYSTWDIFNFKVSQQTALGSTALVDQTMSPFLLHHFGPNDADDPARSPRSISNTSRLRFRANIVAANLPVEAGVLGISPRIDVGEDIDLGPDRPIAIKSRIDPTLTKFTYNYSGPGTYKVAFVASNVTTKGQEKVVKQVEVVIP